MGKNEYAGFYEVLKMSYLTYILDLRLYESEKKINRSRNGFPKETQNKAIKKYNNKTGCPGCKRPLKSNIEHHHKNFDRSDNSLKNDMPIHKNCHKKHHKKYQNVRIKEGYFGSNKKPNEKPLFPRLNPPIYAVVKKKIIKKGI